MQFMVAGGGKEIFTSGVGTGKVRPPSCKECPPMHATLAELIRSPNTADGKVGSREVWEDCVRQKSLEKRPLNKREMNFVPSLSIR